MLQVSGSQIVDGSGRSVLLRGVGLGGWLNMENFITGHPGAEVDHRRAMLRVLGRDRYEYFFERFLDVFFGPADARFLAAHGLNAVRIAINYRHWEDDDRPFELRPGAFRHLDRAVAACANAGIYVIIDAHALPGCQNQDWHSDNPTHRALFWEHRTFQDRAVWLWQRIAEHYRDQEWVAGYNVMNEPGDPDGNRLEPFYWRLAGAIREIDPTHILFLDGNRYSVELDRFGEPIPNCVYAIHDYGEPGLANGGPYPGVTDGSYFDRSVREQVFVRKTGYMRTTGTPIWVGEFGPVYLGEPDPDASRVRLLHDELAIFQQHGAHWSIWTYKDIGVQGLVSVAPDSPWRKRIAPFLDKKRRLGADAWGMRQEPVEVLMRPIWERLDTEFPGHSPFPFGLRWQANRLVRHILLSEQLHDEFAELFRDLDEREIDELMESFRVERCRPRPDVLALLDAAAAGRVH
jgi:hypothetical protein